MFRCAGFSDGTSGGPLLADVGPADGLDTVIGVIGGYQLGGDTPSVSYAARFGGQLGALYQQALSARRSPVGSGRCVGQNAFMNADLVVIGAGALGLSTALHAALRGQSVVVIERLTAGSQASGRAAGLFKSVQADELRTVLARRSIERAISFADWAGAELPVTRVGQLPDRTDRCASGDAAARGRAVARLGRRRPRRRPGRSARPAVVLPARRRRAGAVVPGGRLHRGADEPDRRLRRGGAPARGASCSKTRRSPASR